MPSCAPSDARSAIRRVGVMVEFEARMLADLQLCALPRHVR
jgi:hypothetical protein